MTTKQAIRKAYIETDLGYDEAIRLLMALGLSENEADAFLFA